MPLDLPLVIAVVFAFGFVGLMLGMMAWWGGDHMAMMHRGSAGTDQAPVVSDAGQVTVEMRNLEFFPAKLTVNGSAEVTWVNRDSVPHNVVAKDGSFDSGPLDGGKSWSMVPDQPGTYAYVCTYHPGMEGVLTVQ